MAVGSDARSCVHLGQGQVGRGGRGDSPAFDDGVQNFERPPIADAVEDVAADPPVLHDLGVTQHHQVLRDERLAITEDGLEVADTGLVLAQDRDDGQPGRMGEGLEELGPEIVGRYIQHPEY